MWSHVRRGHARRAVSEAGTAKIGSERRTAGGSARGAVDVEGGHTAFADPSADPPPTGHHKTRPRDRVHRVGRICLYSLAPISAPQLTARSTSEATRSSKDTGQGTSPHSERSTETRLSTVSAENRECCGCRQSALHVRPNITQPRYQIGALRAHITNRPLHHRTPNSSGSSVSDSNRAQAAVLRFLSSREQSRAVVAI
jgi:hypothetical protein